MAIYDGDTYEHCSISQYKASGFIIAFLFENVVFLIQYDIGMIRKLINIEKCFCSRSI